MYTRIRNLPLPNSCMNHDHDYHQIVIATQGCADFEIAGRGGRVDVLRGCLVPAGDLHFYEGIGDNRHLVLDVPAMAVDAGLQRLFDQPRYFEADTGLRLLLGYLQRETDTWERMPDAARCMALGLLASVHRRLFDRDCEAPRRRGRLDLAQLEAYVESRLSEPLDTAQLARVSHLSPGHFHTRFRDATGMTPGRYVLQARLERASRLLRESLLPIHEIAAQVGFASQSALTTAFRRHFGYPPGHLRRVH